MAHHKRRRPKNRRSGCLMCKPHKMNGAKNKTKVSVARVAQHVWDDFWETLDLQEAIDKERGHD